MRKIISYTISEDAPGWPGNFTMEKENCTSIERGNAAYTWTVKLHNHFGTHFDAPKHFNDKGVKITELEFDSFFYDKPLLLDIPKGKLEKIMPEDLKPFESEIRKADLLMIRTGFGECRSTDPDGYSVEGPAVSAKAAQYLVESFENLKAVALDFISLATYSDPRDGELAHRWMLGAYSKNYICIIEDVNLSGLEAASIKSAAAVPLFISGIDSAPVTMWAEC